MNGDLVSASSKIKLLADVFSRMRFCLGMVILAGRAALDNGDRSVFCYSIHLPAYC